jgi:hypothetical protein
MSALPVSKNSTLNIGDYTLAPAIKLSREVLEKNEIEVTYHMPDHEDYSIVVEFRTPVGIIAELMAECNITRAEAQELIIESVNDRFSTIGIPQTALRDLRLIDTVNGSWVEVDCRFFLETKTVLTIDPGIAKIVTFYMDELFAEAKLEDVLKAQLPQDYASSNVDSDETRVYRFAQYLKRAFPWQGQWLLHYTFYMDYQFYEDKVIFRYDPMHAEAFRYMEDYCGDASALLIYDYPVYPAI